MAFRLNDAPTLERPRRRIEAPISNRQWRAPDITSVGRVRLGKGGVGTNSVGRNAIGQVDTLGGDVQILEKKVGEGFSAVWKARNDGDTPGEARLRLLDEGSQEITTGPSVIVEPGEEADLTLEFTPPGDPDEVLYQLEFAGGRPQWHLFVISYFEAKWEAALVDAGFTETEVPFKKSWEIDLTKAVDLREAMAEKLRLQQAEDKRLADAEIKRLADRKAADQLAQAKRAAEQAAFWLKSEAARKQALKLEEQRIAEEAARRPKVEPRGSLQVRPNIAISLGGAEDVMDVSWGYNYISGQEHRFITMKVKHRHGYDQMPVHAASPGTNRSNWRFRFVAGHYQPGTHQVTVQLLSTPTDRNEWTVHHEETKSFHIAGYPGYEEGYGAFMERICNEVRTGRLNSRDFNNQIQANFRGRQTRVTSDWIKRRYESCSN